MATISKWTPFGVALDITATSGTVTRTSSTKCTVKLNVSWKATWDGAQTDYGMDVTSGGVTKTINAANGTKRSSGSASFTGTYTVSANNAVTLPVAVVFKNYSWNGTKSATKTITLNVSVPAWTSYNVTYNANGGSGAPSTQKKWKGQSLTLSSTVPTRTGYTFKGWSTSSGSTTVAYKPSYVYVSEAPLTLYAVWELNTYKIEYSANGGSGAPAVQTKKYGVALKLSTTIPTREKYAFKGWARTASATVAEYQAGSNYTANAAIKLFAIWELAYTKPKISNLTVTRYSDGSPTGEPSDSGTYAYVSFDWSTFQLPATITVTQSPGNISYSTEYTEALTQNYRRGWGNLNPDTTYMFMITVSDGDGRDYSTTLTRTLPGTKFVIDFLAGGNGAAIGKQAEIEGALEVAYETKLSGGLRYPVLEPCDLNELRTPNIYSGRNAKDYAYVCGDSPLPFNNGTFTLEVMSSGPNGQVLQRLTVCDKNNSQTYERWYYTSSWSEWTGGWINATIGSKFAIYGTDSNSTQPKYRKDGRVVEVRGVVTPVNDIATGDDMHAILTLPVGYRPSSPIYLICQGSGARIWLLRVNTDGVVSFSRYRNGDTREVATAGIWLPFHCTFLVG